MRPIKEENLNEADAIGEYGCREVKSSEQEEKLIRDMFEEKGLMQPMTYQHFDVPHLF